MTPTIAVPLSAEEIQHLVKVLEARQQDYTDSDAEKMLDDEERVERQHDEICGRLQAIEKQRESYERITASPPTPRD